MAMATVQKNMPFVKQQFSLALGNSSVVVKFVCAAIIVGYLLSFSEAALNVLTVKPGNVIPPNFWVWTYFTHCFVEVHIWVLICDLGVVTLYGKLLEPLWGALEMLIFFVVVNVVVAVCSTFTYFLFYLVTMDTDYLFETHIHGLAAYLAGFAVATKQVMPDLVLVNSPFGKLRNKHIPLCLLVMAAVVRLIGGVDGPFPIMFGWGLLVSWIYLRFYQKHSNGNRGDMAESFSFASFFPERFQPFIIIISSALFMLLVRVKVCKKPQRKYDVSATTTITVSLPGTDPADAERRRQLALKALNERLSKVEQGSWPSMEEMEPTPPTTPETSLTTESAPLNDVSTKNGNSELPSSDRVTSQITAPANSHSETS